MERASNVQISFALNEFLLAANGKKYRFNLSAAAIWRLCDGRGIGEIGAAIEADYGVPRGRALLDVIQAVTELTQKRLLEIISTRSLLTRQVFPPHRDHIQVAERKVI